MSNENSKAWKHPIKVRLALLLLALCATLVVVLWPSRQGTSIGTVHKTAPVAVGAVADEASAGGNWRPMGFRPGSKTAGGTDKVEPALLARVLKADAGNDQIPVIIQFQDEVDTESGNAAHPEAEREKAAEKRTAMIVAAGGTPKSSYASMCALSATMNRAALARLAQDPQVKRISMDHGVQGSLYTTAKAIGADQV